ncbi:MAG: hypothetical protein U0324_38465 [Polyangiales bacterium]
MQKSWLLEVGGATHRVDVDWDVVITSQGEARVDGAPARAWRSGVKLPGVAESFEVAGRTVTVRQSLFGYDLDLRGAPDVRVVRGEAPYAGGGRNLTKREAVARAVAITAAILVAAAALVFTAHALGD